VILVDTSVWIDHLNDNRTGEVETLRRLVGFAPLLVGDLILCEVLQGLRSDREAAAVERALAVLISSRWLRPTSRFKRRQTIAFCAVKGSLSARRSI
jgi:predicted nucleic acid-binding protein